MSHRPEPVAVAADLIDHGFRLVIDDFGRGSISLTQVMTLHFSAIKLDACLVRQVSHSDRAKQLVRGIIRLAQDLGMRTCAESVETADTLLLLKGLGCDEVQGWHLGRPMPASSLPFDQSRR
jgi:EAL domain-containing protein (putative c-di-GMP-specific phosphodiesterase class I)